MSGHIHRISTKGMCEEDWLRARAMGIGGSEVSAILGISTYRTALDLYLEKIGEYTPLPLDNRFVFFGRLHEPEIARLYQYWDGSEEAMRENYRMGRKIRRVRSVNAFLVNTSYPHLFASIDRMVLATKTSSTGVLECKNLSSFSVRQYADEIPYEHVCQVVQYLLITGWEFADLAIEKDGNDFQVYRFERHDSHVLEIAANILEHSEKFWARVKRAREIKQSIGTRSYYGLHPSMVVDSKTADAICELQQLEPSPVPDASLEQLLNTIFKPEPATIPGTNELWEIAVKYLQSKDNEKLSKLDTMEYSNQIKVAMRNAERADFSEAGAITWKPDKRGVRRLSVNLRL